jgi:hypothetical protein
LALLLVGGLCSAWCIGVRDSYLGAVVTWFSVNGVGSGVTGDGETYFEFVFEKELDTMLW